MNPNVTLSWLSQPVGVKRVRENSDILFFINDLRAIDPPFKPFISYLSQEAKKNKNVLITLVFGEMNPVFSKYLQDEYESTGVHPMWQAGWIQSPINFSDNDQKTLMMYRQNPSLKIESDEDETLLFNQDQWLYVPLKQIRDDAANNPQGYEANMYQIAYPRSRRAPTSMEHFLPDKQKRKVIQLQHTSSGRPQSVEYQGKKLIVFPVSRYGESVGSGSYYGSSTKQFCGTFYYWEPDSDVFLNLGNSMFFPNKILALYHFDPKNELISKILGDYLLTIWNQSYMDQSLETTKSRDLQILFELLKGTPHPLYLFNDLYQDPKGNYMGDIFYAKEDILDQPLCVAARQAGVDTVILAQMPGSTRVVTEVLDTRSRQESVNQLYWLAA